MSNQNLAIAPVELNFQDVKLTCPIEEGHWMLPIRTICQIIDVDFKNQDSWLKQHEYFSQLYRPSTTVGLDGKTRTMNCLSIFDVMMWLGHISNSANRKPESVKKQFAFGGWVREQILNLYKSIEAFQKENKYELGLIEEKGRVLDEIETVQSDLKEYKSKLKTINASLEDVRSKRYTGQTALPFPESS